MKRFQVWGLSAALSVAGGMAVAADPPAPKQPTTLYDKLFGPKKPRPAGPTVAGDPQQPVTITAPIPPQVLADALQAERDAYLRRVSVCTELRRVAIERGDDALARQVEELERQAAALYKARVAGLGVPSVKAPLPEAAPKNSVFAAFDEPRSSDPVSRARNLQAPPTPIPGTTTAEIREVP